MTFCQDIFPTTKITTNDNFLLSNLDWEDILDQYIWKLDDFSIVKTLGIRWNAVTDAFYYNVETNQLYHIL